VNVLLLLKVVCGIVMVLGIVMMVCLLGLWMLISIMLVLLCSRVDSSWVSLGVEISLLVVFGVVEGGSL